MSAEMKDWIQTKAEEITLQRYNLDYCDLAEAEQYRVWREAECMYGEMMLKVDV